MRVIIEPTYELLSKWAASYITRRIYQAKPTAKKPFVLGLPTGSSPIGTYKELIKLCKKGKVSFKHVITFNMDEYVGIPSGRPSGELPFVYEEKLLQPCRYSREKREYPRWQCERP